MIITASCVIGCWVLDAGYWMLDAGYWSNKIILLQNVRNLQSRNDFKTVSSIQNGYKITLDGDQRWHIIATKGEKRLLKKLVSMLELKACGPNKDPKLLFTRYPPNHEKCLEFVATAYPNKIKNLPKNNWRTYHFSLLRLHYHRDIPDVICQILHKGDELCDIITLFHALHPIYRQALDSGGLPFHAGLIEHNGKGILLAGPGDTGKTTCCGRLPQCWRPLGDDEALVVLNPLKKYRAHPFPTWSDYLIKREEKTWNVQYSVPLEGVFFLEQAGSDAVISVGEGQAAILMTESATQVCEKFWKAMNEHDQRRFRKTLFDNACGLARQVPAFRLRVSLKGNFWKKIEHVIGC